MAGLFSKARFHLRELAGQGAGFGVRRVVGNMRGGIRAGFPFLPAGHWKLARHDVSGFSSKTESVLTGRWKSGVPSGQMKCTGALPATS